MKNHIKDLRVKANMTQQQLANLVSVLYHQEQLFH